MKTSKIKTLSELASLRTRWKEEEKKVVLTNGCFDILHIGHVHLFGEAKRLGDILLVAVNTDDTLRILKGPSRPIFPLRERLEILEAVEHIDYLLSFSEETPQRIISVLVPDVLVKGGDWEPEYVVGKKEVEESGGRVVIVPFLKGHSSSDIIEKIVR